ncbi:MAG: ERF family protein [Sphingopyxis sp.]|nr:ERF family protein [Sphingopyxis sp.]
MTESAVILRPETNAAASAMTPADLLGMALERGASVEVMTKLMDLRDRWEAGQHRKAFNEAIAEAKARIPTITKNRSGHNNKRYADFAAIASVIDPVISEYGLSYRFRTTQTDRINVTCILSHKAGHSEETTLSGPADTTGSKNAIQAIGSTLTYLQRYTLVQALGLAASDDDDGSGLNKGADAETISEDQTIELRELIEAAEADEPGLKVYFKIGHLKDLRSDKFDQAKAMLTRKIQKKGQA